MKAFADKLRSVLRPAPRTSMIGPIGLHFADEQLHAVQLRRLASGAMCLRAWASVAYPESRLSTLSDRAALKELVGQLLGRGGFRGRKVVTAMPPEMSRITSLSFRPVASKSEAAHVMQLMDERLEGRACDYVIDYVAVRSETSSQQKVVLVASSKQSDVIDFLEALSHARLQVTELEVSPVAINRLITQLSVAADTNENILILNYGVESSYLTLISGRRLLMDRQIDFGSEHVIEQVAAGLNVNRDAAKRILIHEGLSQQLQGQRSISADDLNPVVEIVRPLFVKLNEELRRARLYVAAESKGETLAHIYTLGSVARWPGADTMLSNISRLPVSSTLPLAAIFDSADGDDTANYSGIGPDLAIATGMALRGLSDA